MFQRGLLTLSVLTLLLAATSTAVAQSDEDFTLRFVGDNEAAPGATAEATCILDFADAGADMQGYQWGVCIDSDFLTIEAEDIVNGADIDGLEHIFQGFFSFDDGWTCGALLDPITATVVEPGDDIEMIIATFGVSATASDLEVTTLEYCDDLGTPPVETQIVAEGAQYTPNIEDFDITIVEAPPLLLKAADAVITINNDGDTLQAAEVVVLLTNEEDTPGAFSFGVSHDSTLLTLSDITLDGTVSEDVNSGDGPDFFATNLEADDGGSLTGGTVAAVFTLPSEDASFETLDTGVDQAIVNFLYEAGDDLAEDSMATIDFSDQLGSPPVGIVISVDGQTLAPGTESGTVTVLVEDQLTRTFLRSDVAPLAAPNGILDVADAIVILQFVTGGDDPICRAAADFNADGVAGIEDGIDFLTWRFAPGGGDPPGGAYPDCDSQAEEPDDGETCLEDHEGCL